MVNPNDITKLQEAMAKRYKGKARLMRPDEMPDVYRVPTGSPELDIATFGGYPMNRMVRPWGGYSSAKSLTVLNIVKMAQMIRDERYPDGMTCVWYDIEGTFDPVLAKLWGIDMDRFLIYNASNTIEDVCETMMAALPHAHIHVIDTVAHCYSIQREQFDANDQKKLVGAEARSWTPLLKRIENEMTEENMIILIDQVRQDINGPRMEKEAGSTIFDHSSSMSLHHVKSTKLYRTEKDGPLSNTRPQKPNDPMTGAHRVNAIDITVEVNKSKVCRPFGKARMRLDLDKMQFDRLYEYLKVGIRLGVVEQAGAYYKFPGAEKSVQGEEKAKIALSNSPQVIAQIDEAIKGYIKEASTF